jgi:hypothetical protein
MKHKLQSIGEDGTGRVKESAGSRPTRQIDPQNRLLARRENVISNDASTYLPLIARGRPSAPTCTSDTHTCVEKVQVGTALTGREMNPLRLVPNSTPTHARSTSMTTYKDFGAGAHNQLFREFGGGDGLQSLKGIKSGHPSTLRRPEPLRKEERWESGNHDFRTQGDQQSTPGYLTCPAA